eukprot:m.1188790 g.1188790  ORF g.1188790 m.1188790 type:complete len:564 (+) comp24554_c3_seq2:1260-2951(+)
MSKGPVVMDSVYNGETYDARLEQPGWDTPSFVASATSAAQAWTKADVLTDAPKGSLAPWSSPPVSVDRVIAPVSVTEPHPGIFVVDFGVNVAGVCKLSNIKLPTGANVTLRHGEILQHAHLPDVKNPDVSMPYFGNLRTARATDVYISAGGDDAVSFMPRFTYHGFRFVQVEGLTTLSKHDIELHHFHTAIVQHTNVSFSSKILTRLQTMAVGAQRSNAMTVETDCDQRDERLGWMGDANLSYMSISLNFDALKFLYWFVTAMLDELNADGSSVDTVPSVRYGGRPGDISWTAAFISAPYALFKTYGTKFDSTFYGDMMKQVNNVSYQCKGEAGTTCPTKYGDWVPPPQTPGQGRGPGPSKPYTSSFSFIGMVDNMIEMGAAFGESNVDSLRKLRSSLVSSFNDAFFHADKASYDTGVMTTYTLPLHLGIVPNASLAEVQKNLLAEVVAAKHHSTCGIIGFKFLFEALAAMGRKDDALAVLEQVDYPGVGYMVRLNLLCGWLRGRRRLWTCASWEWMLLCLIAGSNSACSAAFTFFFFDRVDSTRCCLYCAYTACVARTPLRC